MSEPITVGVIGGSGLYEIEGLEDVREVVLSTPFGAPSDAYVTGTLDGVRVAFLPRHGRGHRIPPSAIPFRANVWGFKQLGARYVIGFGAVGSLKEEVVPGHFVAVDQFIDRTRHREDTFFDRDVVAHVMFADPVSEPLRRVLSDASREAGVETHDGGTYVCMEGPQFSTRAESHLYRSWNASVIGMTNLQEAKLCLEAELAYATLAMATDYDCWHAGHDDVTVDAILAVMAKNVAAAKDVVKRSVARVAALGELPAHSALKGALLTAPGAISPDARRRLGLLIERYLEGGPDA